MPEKGTDRRLCPKARVARSLVSDRERAFMAILMKTFKVRVTVVLKIRVLDVIELYDEPDPRRLAFWHDVLGDKRFDYVVCRHKTLEPLMAVEVDDPRHPSPADTFKAAAAREAKFPLVRLKAGPDLTPEVVRQKLIDEYRHAGPGPLPEELS
jgi:hypothetical protein